MRFSKKAPFSYSKLAWKAADKGFALVATIMLMVMLLILSVGVLSLSSTTIRQSAQEDDMQVARANARMGLMIAIAQLQETMGPDRRISARALTLAKDTRVGATLTASDPKAWWVGVTGTNLNFGLDSTSAVSTGNPAAVWLVSGLNPGTTPASQLGQTFSNPATMFGEYSIDLTQTGGQPLTAGIVEVAVENPNRKGGYAYMVDDEGMKAQLSPSDVNLVNTAIPVKLGDLTPGAYDLGILDGMSDLSSNAVSTYSKLLSVGDLALIGGDTQLAAKKRLGYTTFSRGVLCDVKNGGLKRDLTVAFESDTAFSAVFPRGTGNYTSDYLCIDPDKLSSSSELQQNGYIHWEMFKDFYNIKKYIKTHTDGTKYLDPVRYSKAGVYSGNNGAELGGWAINPAVDPAGSPAGSLLMAGRLGPHAIGNATTTQYPGISDIPYGDYKVDDTASQQPKNHKEFKHSPVIPILQRIQANAWLEYIDSKTLRTHAQMWSSHYNPYNIALNIYGGSGGPRILGAPRITATMSPRPLCRIKNPDGTYGPNTYLDREAFTHNKAQFNSKSPVMALPGRSHVLAYEKSGSWTESQDAFLYNDVVKDLTVESIFRDVEFLADLPPNVNFTINMSMQNASLHHGVDDNMGGGGNMEVCQSFWAPFAWDNATGGNPRPGKLFAWGSIPVNTLNENRMASLGFKLRTTREPNSTIRPLVDANIRCMLGNTRWDSPLNLPLLASYSAAGSGVENEMIMQMSTVDQPKGYTYWGADRDPSFGTDRVVLFDIPRSDLISLGQLQHANAGRFSYEPTYIAGNSYANPRISQTNWKAAITDTFSTSARGLGIFPINGSFNLYDASYIVNEVLWDRYTFTTIPQVADNATNLTESAPDDTYFGNLVSGSANLANARYLPYVPQGSNFNRTTLQMVNDKTNSTGAFYHNAGHVLVDGAFNVNSTSVDAWEAFLSTTHALPVAKINDKGVVTGFETNAEGVRFPRVMSVFGEGVKKSSLDENFWTGFRELEQTEVRELAEAVVDEVEKRGPFLSMADFVNRKLVTGDLGKSGALQAALDNTVNKDIDSDFAQGNQGAGFPGQLLQGDVLQALAPYMTVRSDVFTIRAYGESVDTKTGRVLARAWCEARVQRVTDPVSSSGTGSFLSELTNPTSKFGRKFNIISFRWLNANEI